MTIECSQYVIFIVYCIQNRGLLTYKDQYLMNFMQVESQKPKYRMFNERVRIHYPTWTYDPDNTTDEVEIFITTLSMKQITKVTA